MRICFAGYVAPSVVLRFGFPAQSAAMFELLAGVGWFRFHGSERPLFDGRSPLESTKNGLKVDASYLPPFDPGMRSCVYRDDCCE